MIHDRIDQFELAWTEAYPDLDPWPLRILGRVTRLAGIIERKGDELRKSFGLNLGEIQVMAALRRALPSFTASPKELAQLTLVTSAAVTSRLNSLEEKGLLTRRIDEQSRRRILVALTPKGVTLIEEYMRTFVTQRSEFTSALSAEERQSYSESLRHLLLLVGDEKSDELTIAAVPEFDPL